MNEISYTITANEPKVHPLIRNSFVFVPTAGMRNAPEILILEFFREVFFHTHYGATGGKDLNPNELTEDKKFIFTNEERAVLYALRGRRRNTRNSPTQHFFAPSFPALAENAWLGKKRERVILNFLLKGPIAQYLWGEGKTESKEQEQKKFVDKLYNALVGQNSFAPGDDPKEKEILSVALQENSFEIKTYDAKEKLKKGTWADTVIKITHDEISERIYNDLIALCDLEGKVPRMQWLQIFMAFLRFSMPMWLLAQMQITNLLHRYLLATADFGEQAVFACIEREIAGRNRGLLHPSLTPSREIFEKIEQYMKKRIEMNILLYLLEQTREGISKKRLEIRGAGESVLTIEKLLHITRDARNDMKSSTWFQEKVGEGSFKDFLTREGEQHAAWRDPLKKGQGKNIDEFFRVLYRADQGDEIGGFLLLPEGRGASRGFRVFPGQLLLKTITFLAAQDKKTNGTTRGGGKLVLEDLENHFQQYGVDFCYAADARPLLMRELQAMGLLTGSPDAGGSVPVACPYS